MLAYSGVLGLGSLSYWVGRSHPLALFGVFPTWGLCIALLSWWVLTRAAARRTAPAATLRLWALPSVAVLTAFGLMVSAIAQFPSPRAQLWRLEARAAPTAQPQTGALAVSSFDLSDAARFVEQNTSPGEQVTILASLGHGIAERSGVVNVSPFSHQDSIVFAQQMAMVLRAADEAGVNKVFLGPSYPEIPVYLRESGYVAKAQDQESQLVLYLDAG
jgi:hypothetical protein